MDLPALAAELLGGQLESARRVAGGDLSQVVRLRLADGREVMAKNGPAPLIEAAMLSRIRATGAPAPEVLAVSEDVLVLSVVTGTASPAGAWSALGRAMSLLHGTTGERYGWADDFAFGPMEILNGWTDDWHRFWSERRLLPQLPHLPRALGARVEALAAELPWRLPARPPAALLHGDLWGGNVLANAGRITALIDPACYYGDAAVDLAMLQLFDTPPAEFYAAYPAGAAVPADRLAIYRLWPALVHLRLFGSGYRALVERQLDLAGI